MLSDKIKGYFCGAISGASYGLIPLFSLPIMRQGVDFDSLLLYRYLLAAAVMVVIMASRGKLKALALHRNEIGFVVLLGIIYALSSIFMFKAFDYMATGLISTMYFVYPVFTALMMALFYGEKMSWGRVLALVMTIGGVSLLYVSDGEDTMSLMGVALTFGAALAYAVYIVITNKSRMRHAGSSKIAKYYNKKQTYGKVY